MRRIQSIQTKNLNKEIYLGFKVMNRKLLRLHCYRTEQDQRKCEEYDRVRLKTLIRISTQASRLGTGIYSGFTVTETEQRKLIRKIRLRKGKSKRRSEGESESERESENESESESKSDRDRESASASASASASESKSERESESESKSERERECECESERESERERENGRDLE